MAEWSVLAMCGPHIMLSKMTRRHRYHCTQLLNREQTEKLISCQQIDNSICHSWSHIMYMGAFRIRKPYLKALIYDMKHHTIRVFHGSYYVIFVFIEQGTWAIHHFPHVRFSNTQHYHILSIVQPTMHGHGMAIVYNSLWQLCCQYAISQQ